MVCRNARPLWGLVVLLVPLACASGAGDESANASTFTTTGPTTLSSSETGTGPTTGDGDGDPATGDGDGDGPSTGDGDGDRSPVLDVLGAETQGSADDGPMDSGCEKVDLILSVDASSSMQSELSTLFDTFLEVKDILAVEVGEGIEDFHVGVMNACNSPPFLHNWGAGYTNCDFPPGQNWLESADPLLDQRFACVIDIPFQSEALEGNGGTNGGYNGEPDFCEDGPDEDEQPALAAAAAIQPSITENAGMVRDDAILFVVAITDEDEALANVNSAQQIHDYFMQDKDPGEVVFLGIGGTDCQSAYDGDNVQDSEALAAVAAAFGEYGLFRTMCSGQGPDPIRAAFQEALTTLVDEACDEFTPPE